MSTLTEVLNRFDAELIADDGQTPYVVMHFQTDLNGGAITYQRMEMENGGAIESLESGPIVSSFFDNEGMESEDAEGFDVATETAVFATLRDALADIDAELLNDAR
jgi:hypothetical protein